MRGIIFALVFVAPPPLKKWLLKRFCGAKFGRHSEIGWFSSVIGHGVEFGDYACVRAMTLVKLQGEFHLGHYSEISSFNLIYGASDLRIGNKSYIGPQSLINVEKEVRIGNNSALGPRTTLFTHGSGYPLTRGYWAKLAGVTLGDFVWCAAGVYLQPGAEIGDDSFVNAGSVVSQAIPAGSIAEGNPAKVVHSMERVKRKMTPKRVSAALREILTEFAEIHLLRERRMSPSLFELHKDGLNVRWEGRDYEVVIVEPGTEVKPAPSGCRRVYLVHCPDWKPQDSDYYFDIPNIRAPFTSDPVHTELALFMRKYFGMWFENSA